MEISPCVPGVHIDGSHFLISTYIHAWKFMVQNLWTCWVFWWSLKFMDQNLSARIDILKLKLHDLNNAPKSAL